MEARIKKLEEDVSEIKIDLITIKTQIPQLATTVELYKMKSSIIQWMVATMLSAAALASAIGFGLAKLL